MVSSLERSKEGERGWKSCQLEVTGSERKGPKLRSEEDVMRSRVIPRRKC